MSNYRYLTVVFVTEAQIAANNRVESDGNTTQLRRIRTGNDEYRTAISSDTFNFAIRMGLQKENKEINRSYVEKEMRNGFEYADPYRENYTKEPTIDDDAFGFFVTKPARKKTDDNAAEKGDSYGVRAKFCGNYGVSLRPFVGEKSFHASVGKLVEKASDKEVTTLYNEEIHFTEYQFTRQFNLTDFKRPDTVTEILDQMENISNVGGNHSRVHYDYSPVSIVFRFHNFAPQKIANCFELDANEKVHAPKLLRLVESGEIDAKGIIVGGEISQLTGLKTIQEKGVQITPSVRAAFELAKKTLK